MWLILKGGVRINLTKQLTFALKLEYGHLVGKQGNSDSPQMRADVSELTQPYQVSWHIIDPH